MIISYQNYLDLQTEVYRTVQYAIELLGNQIETPHNVVKQFQMIEEVCCHQILQVLSCAQHNNLDGLLRRIGYSTSLKTSFAGLKYSDIELKLEDVSIESPIPGDASSDLFEGAHICIGRRVIRGWTFIADVLPIAAEAAVNNITEYVDEYSQLTDNWSLDNIGPLFCLLLTVYLAYLLAGYLLSEQINNKQLCIARTIMTLSCDGERELFPTGGTQLSPYEIADSIPCRYLNDVKRCKGEYRYNFSGCYWRSPDGNCCLDLNDGLNEILNELVSIGLIEPCSAGKYRYTVF